MACENELLKARLEIQDQAFEAASKEIHDNIGQVLALVRLNISRIDVVEKSMILKIDSSKELIDRAIQDLRDLSKMMDPGTMAKQSLSSLINGHVNSIRNSRICTISLEINGEEGPVSCDKNLITYLIIQELISNNIKQLGPENIFLFLDFSDDLLTVTIRSERGGNMPFDGGLADPDEKKIVPADLYYRIKLIGARFSATRYSGGGLDKLIVPLTF